MVFEKKDRYNISDLLKIMELLRSENGCPWDKVQTHESIRKNFIEETYEVIEAIDNNDIPLMREELGDVLLQVVFHARMEEEIGNFTFDDVVDELCAKLVLRHPHVFGEVNANNEDEALASWDKAKKESKKQSDSETLVAVSKALPALMRADKVGSRASKVGYDFSDAKSALEKLKSEIVELEEVLDKPEAEEEMGDVLFSAVNVARKLKLDSELILGASTDKFINRFAKAEQIAKDNGTSLSDLSEEELDLIWEQAKKQL